MKGDPKKEEKDVLKRRKILEEPFKKVAFAFVRTTIIILVIFYLGILLISRTAGFRSIIAERLESRLGVPFEIGGSGFDARLNLHTRDIKSTAPLLESGHIQVDQLSSFWSLAGLLSKEEPLVHKIVLDGVSLQVVATEKNGWQPGVFGMLGKIDGFDQMAGSSAKANAAGTNEVAAVKASAESKKDPDSKSFRSILIIQNSQINLMQGDGRRVANFGDVDFQYVPGFNEGLEVQLFKLDGNYVMVNSKVPRQKLELEVLNAGDEVMVKRLRAGADLLVSLAGFLGGDDVAEVVPPPVIASQELDRPAMDPVLALETPAGVPDDSRPSPALDPVDASSARVEHLQVQPLPATPPRVINVGTLTSAPASPPNTEGHPASMAAASTNDVADEIISQIEAIFNPVATNDTVGNLVHDPPGPSDDPPMVLQPDVGVVAIPVPEPLPPVPEPVLPEPIPIPEPVVVHTPPVSVPPRRDPPVPSREEGLPPPVVAPAIISDIPPAIDPPNVLSEIEKVLEDAMRMQEESLKRREVAERKFAAISNQYLVISNEIERAVDP